MEVLSDGSSTLPASTKMNDPTQSEQIAVSCSDQVGSFFVCDPCGLRVKGFFNCRCHVSLFKSKQSKIRVKNV